LDLMCSNFNNTNIKSSYFVGTHGDVCTKSTKSTELKELSDDLINKSFWYQGKPSSSGKNPHEAEGSIYGFVFDREKKTISVSFNNKYIHVFNKVDDEEYYPCIDFYYQLAEVEFCKPVTDIKNTMVSDTLKSIGKKAEKVPLIGALNFYKNKVTNITGGIVNSLSKDNKEELKKESENYHEIKEEFNKNYVIYKDIAKIHYYVENKKRLEEKKNNSNDKKIIDNSKDESYESFNNSNDNSSNNISISNNTSNSKITINNNVKEKEEKKEKKSIVTYYLLCGCGGNIGGMSGFKTKLEAEKSQKNLSGNPNACSYCGSKIKEVSSFSVIIDVDSDDTDRYKAFCGCGQHVSSSSKKKLEAYSDIKQLFGANPCGKCRKKGNDCGCVVKKV